MRGNSQARAFFRGAAALLILAMPALLWGQGLSQGQDFVAPAPAPPRGLQVYSVSAYAVYYPSCFPDTVTFQPGIGTFESDLGLGASTRIGWQRMGKESSFSFLYAPSYTGRVRYAAWNFLISPCLSPAAGSSRANGPWTFLRLATSPTWLKPSFPLRYLVAWPPSPQVSATWRRPCWRANSITPN